MEKSKIFIQFDQQIFQTVKNANATLVFGYLENRYNLHKRNNELRKGDNAFYIKNFEEVNITIGLGKDALKAALNALVEAKLITTIYDRSKYGTHYFIIINETTVDQIRNSVNVQESKEQVKKEKQEEGLIQSPIQTKNFENMKNKVQLEDIKIVLEVKKILKEGQEYTNAYIKEVLNLIASNNGITGTIPASAITNIANTTKLDTTRQGKKFKGYKINFYNFKEVKKETPMSLDNFPGFTITI